MKFLVDAQLPPGLCDWLEERGHSAVHVGTLAQEALRDWQIADYAEAERLVLVSKDEDFVELRLPDRFVFLWLRCGNVTNRNLREWLGGEWEAVETRLAAGVFFAGHGSYNKTGGVFVTQDASLGDEGIPMTEVIGLANRSKAKERVIILDCCHSGAIDELSSSIGTAVLEEGVSILAACRSTESAMERGGRGLFSSNVCDTLDGGAADVRGFVTIAAAYAYVVEVFTHWDQRALFRASLSRVSSLRRAEPAVSDEKLIRIMALFPDPDFVLPLSPAYEPTAEPRDVEKEEVFAILQQFRAARLLEPVGNPHLYYAAMESKACRLTPLGRFYWQAIASGKI